ncbi:hypothetical protein BD770DRAFT_223165 [Pilaira anomala]|nr:hypothetical protein BD770DRAFT_223165 [Pilaira anomala]
MIKGLIFVIFSVITLSISLTDVLAAPISSNYDDSQTSKSTFISNTDILQKRDAGLVQALSWGLSAVQVGVKSTIDGVRNPKVPATKQSVEAAAMSAGENTGSAIGNALKGGKLL